MSRIVPVAVMCFVLSLAGTIDVNAQASSGGDPWGVRVAVQGWQLTAPPHTHVNGATFHVTNTGSDSSAFTFTCSGTGGVGCDSVPVSSAALGGGETVAVVAWYSVADSGGVISLSAVEEHGASDVGSYVVGVSTELGYSGPLEMGGPGGEAQAEECLGECGGGGAYGVDVLDYSAVTRPANSGPYTIYWGMFNTGTSSNTYTMTCLPLGVTCNSVTPGSIWIPGDTDDQVTVTYSVGSSSGTLRLRATGTGATDTGTLPVTVANAPPLVSLAGHNAGYRNMAVCAGCFEATWAHSTPAYFSFGAPRNVTLAYNSATVDPTLVVFVDLTAPGGFTPTTYSLQLKLVSTGAFLTLLNGSQTVYYTASTTQTIRAALALDARANGLGTGWHDVQVVATANYASGGPASTTATTRLLMVDETNSPFGSGVTVAGLQRLHFKAGSYGVAVTEGDGSIAYYHRTSGVLPFITPGGTALSLQQISTNYRRYGLDSSYVEFNAQGRMTKAVDRFGNTTTFLWTDTLLTGIKDPMNKQITLGYSGGKLVSITDPGTPARVTTVTIDGSGNLTRITDPDSLYTSFSYWDTEGRLKDVTSRGGKVSTHTFSSQLPRLATVKAPQFVDFQGTTVTPTVTLTPVDLVVWQPAVSGTSAGNAKAAVGADTVQAVVTDPLGATTTLRLDRFGAERRVIDASGAMTLVTRDSMGRATWVREPSGANTTVYYGTGYEPELNYLRYLIRRVKHNNGVDVVYSYTTRNDVATATINGTRYDLLYHDGTSGPVGALKSVYVGNTNTWPDISATATLIRAHFPDGAGRDTAVADGLGHRTSYSYAAMDGNLAVVEDPLGATWSFLHDPYGRVDTLTTPGSGYGSFPARVWRFVYGAMNQPRTAYTPLSDSVGAVYDTDFRVTALTEPGGQVYHTVYGAAGQTMLRKDLGTSSRADSFAYDIGGHVRTVTTRGGATIHVAYDDVGRTTEITAPGTDTVRYRYDVDDRWVVGETGGAYDSLSFSSAGRLETWRQVLNGSAHDLLFEYDLEGRLTKRSLRVNGLVLLGEEATWEYDQRGLVKEMVAAGVRTKYIYNDDLRPVGWAFGPDTLPDSLWAQYAVLNEGHRSAEEWYSGVQVDAEMGGGTQYFDDGRLSQSYSGGQEDGFKYDEVGRVIRECLYDLCIGPWMTYDASGNRTDVSKSPVYGPGNRLLQFDGWTFTYDLDGRLSSRAGPSSSSQYHWDALGRLVAIVTGTDTVKYSYSAFGHRIAKDFGLYQEWFLYDRGSLIGELGPGGWPAIRYSWHPGTDQLVAIENPTWTGVAVTDPVNRATVLGMIDVAGTPPTWKGKVLKSFQYDAWGKPAIADTGVAVRIRFAGHQYDQESGLYYMRARYYDPAIGRFISEDPIGIGGGLNLYVYAANDPVNVRDARGLYPGPCCVPDPRLPNGPAGPPVGPPDFSPGRRVGVAPGRFPPNGAPIGDPCDDIAKRLKVDLTRIFNEASRLGFDRELGQWFDLRTGARAGGLKSGPVGFGVIDPRPFPFLEGLGMHFIFFHTHTKSGLPELSGEVPGEVGYNPLYNGDTYFAANQFTLVGLILPSHIEITDGFERARCKR